MDKRLLEQLFLDSGNDQSVENVTEMAKALDSDNNTVVLTLIGMGYWKCPKNEARKKAAKGDKPTEKKPRKPTKLENVKAIEAITGLDLKGLDKATTPPLEKLVKWLVAQGDRP